MKKEIQKKWIVTLIIWFCVLGLTSLNIQHMQKLMVRKKADEKISIDTLFLNQNRAAIAAALKAHKSLFHSVDTLRFGILEIDENLKRLSKQYDLQYFQLKLPQEPNTVSPAKIEIDFYAPVTTLMAWMNDIKGRYPYLLIQSMHLENDIKEGLMRIDMRLDYRFKIAVVN